MKQEQIEELLGPSYFVGITKQDLGGSVKYAIPRSHKVIKDALPNAARVQLLAKALREAREDMEGWQAYASEYFRDKHDAAADLAKIDAALKEAGIKE